MSNPLNLEKIIKANQKKLDIIYLAKFGNANNVYGTSTSKIAFSGKASFIGTTADLKINLRYSDIDYFNDPKFKGLVIKWYLSITYHSYPQL